MAGTAAGAQKARQKRLAGVQAPEQVDPVEPVKDAAQIRLEAKFGARRQAGVLKPTHYVVSRRPLQWEGLTLQVGETVPGAQSWPRLDAWVRAGRVAPAYGGRMTETSTPEPEISPDTLPEELNENIADAPEDDDPLANTGEELPDDEEPVVEVSK